MNTINNIYLLSLILHGPSSLCSMQGKAGGGGELVLLPLAVVLALLLADEDPVLAALVVAKADGKN